MMAQKHKKPRCYLRLLRHRAGGAIVDDATTDGAYHPDSTCPVNSRRQGTSAFGPISPRTPAKLIENSGQRRPLRPRSRGDLRILPPPIRKKAVLVCGELLST